MAPPSQAGRFKPRKPAKKIRPGAATGAPVPPPAPASSPAAAAGRGRGDRGGGGRGRGGRGRGRHVIQQGQAFFAGNQPTTTTSKGSSAKGGLAAAVARRLQGQAGSGGGRGTGSSLVKREENEHATQEEIVGMLDESIGGSVPDNVKSAPKLLSGGGGGESKFDQEEPLAAPPASAFEYDSDSSLEIDAPRHVPGVVMPSQKPLTLPFPKAKYPPGVGAPFELGETRQPFSADDADTNNESAPISPFVSLANDKDLREESESWFLLQLPTRLPPLPGVPPVGEANADANKAADTLSTSEVSTAPLRRDGFDNSLVKANPGRIGKFLVYESGKTVLVLDGQDGLQYHLNVSEGLSCSFRQQAVVIDNESQEFVPLGDVSKTVVVTPDVETAFIGSR